MVAAIMEIVGIRGAITTNDVNGMKIISEIFLNHIMLMSSYVLLPSQHDERFYFYGSCFLVQNFHPKKVIIHPAH